MKVRTGRAPRAPRAIVAVVVLAAVAGGVDWTRGGLLGVGAPDRADGRATVSLAAGEEGDRTELLRLVLTPPDAGARLVDVGFGEQRMVAGATSLGGVVAHLGLLLLAETRHYRAVPVQDEPPGQGLPDRTGGCLDPLGLPLARHAAKEAAYRIVGYDLAHLEQPRQGGIVAQALDMDETAPVAEGGEGEGEQHVPRIACVWAGPLNRTAGG